MVTAPLRANYHYNRVNRHYVDDSVFRGSPYLDYSDTRFTGRTHFAEVYNQWKGKTGNGSRDGPPLPFHRPVCPVHLSRFPRPFHIESADESMESV